MINYIWSSFIIVGIIYSILTNNFNVLNEEILASSKTTLDLILKLFPMVALWTGIMNIAKESCLLNSFAKKLSPLLKKLFPEIPDNHKWNTYWFCQASDIKTAV